MLYSGSTEVLQQHVSLAGKLAIVELSGDFGFARNSSKHPCTLASFSRARIPRSACTRDVTLSYTVGKRLYSYSYAD